MSTGDKSVSYHSLLSKDYDQIVKLLRYDRKLTHNKLKLITMMISAAKVYDNAIRTYEIASETYHNRGRVTNVYGRGRRLEVVRWTTSLLADKSATDFGVGRTWISEGIPETANLVAVAIESAPDVVDSNFCVIFEDSTFKPLDWDEVIPELTVLTVDVQKSMERERNLN